MMIVGPTEMQNITSRTTQGSQRRGLRTTPA